MEEYLNDLVYYKYEQFSVQYIISPEQIRLLIESLKGKVPQADLSSRLDELIESQSYFNLMTSHVNDFEAKLKHNINLAQTRQDLSFLNFLRRKFQIEGDL